jgi:hypothetical protein
MKTDDELRPDVERELESEPAHDHRTIGVSVVDRVVTPARVVIRLEAEGPSAPWNESRVRGTVRSFLERRDAEWAAAAAPGVATVHNDHGRSGRLRRRLMNDHRRR